jgi:AraC-like DNA-binding protein
LTGPHLVFVICEGKNVSSPEGRICYRTKISVELDVPNEPPPASVPQLGLEWYAPHPVLSPWIQCYWVAKSPRLIQSPLTENLYPDGGTSLVLDFANSAMPVVSFNAFFRASRVEFSGRIDKIGIRFQPGGAFQLLGLEMPLIANLASSVDDLGLQDYKALAEQLALKITNIDRIEQLNEWFLRKAVSINLRRSRVYEVLQRMQKSRASINEVMAHVPISRRQLERKFQLEVGITPAILKQLQQVKKARSLISLNPQASLAQVAVDAGFYDQAHFNRQFQKITGQTPGQYRQKKMSQKYNTE